VADPSVAGHSPFLGTSKEQTMPTLKSEQQLVQAAAKKAERERDAVQAMRDYEAEKRTAHANMMRLRALREAREAAGAQAERKKSAAKEASATRGKTAK
jgi:hypothetical protein